MIADTSTVLIMRVEILPLNFGRCLRLMANCNYAARYQGITHSSLHGNHKLVTGFALVDLDVPRILFTETRQMLKASFSSLHVCCSAMRMQRGVGTEESNCKKTDLKSRRNIFALGFVSFFTDVSSEMVFSLLPTFILGLPGSSRVMLGLIEGAAEAVSYGMRAISGIFSDKFRKRKAIVLIGYGLSSVVKPLFSVVQTAMDALVIRVADRIGKGIRTAPRDALLSESASEKQRGAAFGLHRTLDQSGAILGPVIASTLMLFLGFTARDVFWLSFIPGLAALLLLVFLVEERVAKGTGRFKLL